MEHFNVKGTEKYMTVGGEKYKADELETNARTEVVKFDVTECGKANGVQFETSYNFYLDDYGNVIASRRLRRPPRTTLWFWTPHSPPTC